MRVPQTPRSVARGTSGRWGARWPPALAALARCQFLSPVRAADSHGAADSPGSRTLGLGGERWPVLLASQRLGFMALPYLRRF